MRTRVFLVLVAIAIGGAGAGIYLGDRRPGATQVSRRATSRRCRSNSTTQDRNDSKRRVESLEAELQAKKLIVPNVHESFPCIVPDCVTFAAIHLASDRELCRHRQRKEGH